MKKFLIAGLLLSASLMVAAKIAPPALDVAAKAKAAETVAKTA
jgi:hypothetical protein